MTNTQTKLAVAGAALLSWFTAGVSMVAAQGSPPIVMQSGSGTAVGIITNIVVTIINIILAVIGIIAVLFIVIAGVRLVVSGGDEGQKDTAKKTIIYAIVGLLIIIFAAAIVRIVTSLFSAPAGAPIP